MSESEGLPAWPESSLLQNPSVNTLDFKQNLFSAKPMKEPVAPPASKGFGDCDFFVFDTETTGLSPLGTKDGGKRSQIIEFAGAYLKPSSYSGKHYVSSKIDEFVKLPDGEKLPDEIKSLTHITDEMLSEEGISEAELADMIAGILNGAERKLILVCYNSQFDLTFVRKLMEAYGKKTEIQPSDKLGFIDAMAMYKDMYAYDKDCVADDGHIMTDSERDEYLIKYSRKPRALGHRLDAAVKNLNVFVKNTHRAIDDALATVGVFKGMVARVTNHPIVEDVPFKPESLPFSAIVRFGTEDSLERLKQALPKNMIRKRPGKTSYIVAVGDRPSYDALMKEALMYDTGKTKVLRTVHKAKADPAMYLNVFGYNPKFGVSYDRIPGVDYIPQKGFAGMEIFAAKACAQDLGD